MEGLVGDAGTVFKQAVHFLVDDLDIVTIFDRPQIDDYIQGTADKSRLQEGNAAAYIGCLLYTSRCV